MNGSKKKKTPGPVLMLPDKAFFSLRISQAYLVHELQRRGVVVAPLDCAIEAVTADYGDHQEVLIDIESSLLSYPAALAAANKDVAKRLLGYKGLSVPVGATFGEATVNEALDYAKKLGFPVVVKPRVGTQGTEVHVALGTRAELHRAIRTLLAHEPKGARFLVEQHIPVREYRIFVTRNGDYAVLWRDPCHVMGNGRDRVETLIAAENDRRWKSRTCLGQIVLDKRGDHFLARAGLTRRSIPAQGKKVSLAGTSNVKTGAICHDVTDAAHPDTIKLALAALSAFPGLPWAGIDFMTDDIRRPQSADTYRILEVNAIPGLGMHMAPGRGKPRDVASVVADIIFPETAKARRATRRSGAPGAKSSHAPRLRAVPLYRPPRDELLAQQMRAWR